MATEAIEQATPETAETTAAPANGKRTVLILAVVGIVAGVAAGLYGVGPVLAKRRTATSGAKHEEAPAATVTHAIENLVLNPAGSGGTRFLMVTATFELRDGSAEQRMHDREAEVRDHILSLLSKKSVEELTDVNARDAVKKQVLDAVSPLFPKGDVVKVFFPQFVIQ